jgi:hypothetical protein
MGFTTNAAGEMSVALIQLGVDLASFNNVSNAQMMADIQSLYSGSAEVMLKYGANIKAAAVEQEAFNLGLITSKDQMNDVIKAQAILSLFYAQSADAIGDYERSMGSLTNQQKLFNTTMDTIIVEIGKAFLPMVTDVLTGINE